MTSPKDLERLDDPLEIFHQTTRLISKKQAELDKTAAIRARAVAALYARGYSYRDLAKLLDLSPPRIGQLIGSTNDAAVQVLRAWAEIEGKLSQLVDFIGGDQRRVYQSAVAYLTRSGKFDEAALEDLEQIRRVRSQIVHAHRDMSSPDAKGIAERAVYLNALLQVFLTEESKRHNQVDTAEKLVRPIDWKNTMTRVRWADLERTPLYEDMVSVLLSRLHPNAERIDGIGGDGGRDLQIRSPEKLDLFELKSFVGRISSRNPNRRRQIEASLRRAAELRPDSWGLVVPIDPNKEELKWFDGLRQTYPFQMKWYGRTWLDDQMAAFPDIQRYYIEGIQDEILKSLRELNQEQSTLDAGTPDAIIRLDHLRTKLNELDPQYRFEVVPGSAQVAIEAFPGAAMYSERQGEHGPVTIAVIPKYRDALRDRPIMVRADVHFPETEVGEEAATRFKAFQDFGDPAILERESIQGIDVDAPGGLGGALAHGRLIVGSAPATDFLLDARLRVLNEIGSQVASLPVRFTTAYAGQRGRTIIGQDATGVLQISARFDEAIHKITVDMEIRPVSGLLPGTLLAPLRLAHALRSPNTATISVAKKDLWEPIPLTDLNLISREYLELVENLARIQTETNTTFPLPDEISAEDLGTLRRLVRLLDGESIGLKSGPVEFILKPGAPQPWQEQDKQEGYLAMESEITETLMGEEIPLGLCSVIIGPTRFKGEKIPDSSLPSGHIRVKVIPQFTARTLLRRGSLVTAKTDEPSQMASEN